MRDEVAKKEASLREDLAEGKKSGVTEMQSLAQRVVVRFCLSVPLAVISGILLGTMLRSGLSRPRIDDEKKM